MKVCFATYDQPYMGGIASWLQRLLPLLQTVGIEVELHVMGLGRKPAINWLKQLSIPVRWMPLRLDMLSAVRSFLQFLEEGQPDIYVPVDNVPAFYAAGYARRGGIPTVGPLMSDHPYTYAFVDEFVNGDPDFRLSAVVPCSTFVESQVSTTATALGVTVRRIACGVPIPARIAEL